LHEKYGGTPSIRVGNKQPGEIKKEKEKWLVNSIGVVKENTAKKCAKRDGQRA
jgi:hypothetical protein